MALIYISLVVSYSCKSERSENAEKKWKLCEAEKNTQNNKNINFPITTRFYDIIIKATDQSGNVGETSCTVIVVPNNEEHYSKSAKPPRVNGKGKGKGTPHLATDLIDEYNISQKRYKIGTFSHIWDFTLDNTVTKAPSPAPTPGKGKGNQMSQKTRRKLKKEQGTRTINTKSRFTSSGSNSNQNNAAAPEVVAWQVINYKGE